MTPPTCTVLDGIVLCCNLLYCRVSSCTVANHVVLAVQVMESADAGPVDVWRRARLTLPGLPQQGFRFGVPTEEFTEWDGPGKQGGKDYMHRL